MKIRPLGDKILVQRVEAEEKTAGGIVLPDAAKEKPQRGEVKAVGKDVEDVKVGDVILFDRYSGSKIKLDGEEHLIIKEEDILGILK